MNLTKAVEKRLTPLHLANEDWWFLASGVVLLVAFSRPLYELGLLALGDERYTYIIAVPPISFGLLVINSDKVFRNSRNGFRAGILILLVSSVITMGGRNRALAPEFARSTTVFAMLLAWTGLFLLCYGYGSLRSAAFPFLFLLLLIPLPGNTMDQAVAILQRDSANVTAEIYKLMGVPFFRDVSRFYLPGIEIEVAKECSGIRSALAFLLSGIVAAHLLIRAHSKQFIFVAVILPVVIFKNAVRIVTISWLGVYVDHGYFFGYLHRYGGLPFSLLAVSLLALVLLALQRRSSPAIAERN